MNQPLTPEQYEAKIAAMQAALAEIIEQSKREPDWHVAKLRSIASAALSGSPATED